MRTLLILILFSCLLFPGCPGVVAQTSSPCDTTDVFQAVETMPQFAGGDAALMDYLKDNIMVPSSERGCKIESTIYLTFIIDTSGKTTCAEILRPVPDSCILQNGFGDSLIAMIYKMPLWIPGMHNSRKAKVRLILPVHIDLSE